MTDTDGLLAQAYQLQQTGALKQAIALYQQLDRPEARHFEALAYAELGDLETAIGLFHQALKLAPEDAVLHNNLANAYKKKRLLPEAMHHYQEAIRLGPQYAEAHNNLAGLFVAQGGYKEALHHYNLALQTAPDYAAAHYNLGLLFLKSQQLAPAYTQFKNVLALNEVHLESWFYIGILDLEAGRLAEAEQAFESALMQDPNHVEAMTNLGAVYLRQDKNQDAINCFSKALALDNHHLEARNNLASTFMHFDRYENALMHYDVLLINDPKNIEYLYNSGVAEMALGHLADAIRYFERVLAIQADHFAALNNLASIYMRKDDKVKAIGLLQQAVQANPKDKPSQHMLNALTGASGGEDTCIEYSENLFNNYALYYDEHVQKYLHYTLPNHILKAMDTLGLKTVARALDLGAGTGLTGQVLRDFTKKLDGVDISTKMLAIAEKKHIYDKLIKMDVCSYLQTTEEFYDLIVAADILPYFGDLSALFTALILRLKDQGHFIFTTEISPAPGWQLQASVRYAHHRDYLLTLAAQSGMHCVYFEEVIARQQEGRALTVYLVACRKI